MVRNAMSATDFYILQYLWTRETPATFAEIMVHFNEVEKKAWKKQTVNTEIEFHFEKAAPDFTDKSTKAFVVHMNSKAFGKSNTFKIGLE